MYTSFCLATHAWTAILARQHRTHVIVEISMNQELRFLGDVGVKGTGGEDFATCSAQVMRKQVGMSQVACHVNQKIAKILAFQLGFQRSWVFMGDSKDQLSSCEPRISCSCI